MKLTGSRFFYGINSRRSLSGNKKIVFMKETEKKESEIMGNFKISEDMKIAAAANLYSLETVKNKDIRNILETLERCVVPCDESENQNEHVEFMLSFLHYFMEILSLSKEEFNKRMGVTE